MIVVYPSLTKSLTYFSARCYLLKQSSGVVPQSAVVHSGKDIRRISICPNTRSRQADRYEVAQPERAILMSPCLPQVAVDPVERDEVDRESFLVLAFGDGGTRFGLEGDLIGVLSSPCMTVTMEGRRGLRFLGVSELEFDLRTRLYNPMSSSSAISASWKK